MESADKSEMLTYERVDPTGGQEAGEVRQRRIARCYEDYVASHGTSEQGPTRGGQPRKPGKGGKN